MPGLIRGVARTAVVAGTASAVSGRVQRRQQGRWAAQDAQQQGYPPQQTYAAPAPTYAPPPPPPPAYAQPVYAEPVYAEPAAEAPDMDAKIAQLKQLAELRDAGILTHAEFESQKAQILAG
jgi:hypothetical protein